VKWRPFQ